MLTIYRRHGTNCPNRHDGRDYRRCKCPIWMQGTLGGRGVRKSLDQTSWDTAQRIVREMEARGSVTGEVVDVERAVTEFLEEREHGKKVTAGTLKNLRVLLKDQLLPYCKKERISLLSELDSASVRRFRQTWKFSGITANKKLERLRSFFRFCLREKWLTENPAEHLDPVEVKDPPTLPFSDEEWKRIVEALAVFPDNYGRPGGDNAKRLRAMVYLLRHSGLRIGDAVALERRRLTGNRLFLRTAKTGQVVSVPLPPYAVEALTTMPGLYEDRFFSSGESTLNTATNKWRGRLAKLFKLAKVEGGHPHRFRDTAAVNWLLSGLTIDEVATLLGHSNTKVTEKSYLPWVRERQVRLEEKLAASW